MYPGFIDNYNTGAVDGYSALNELINSIPGFLYRCQNDRNWSMIYVSSQCEEVTGYSPEELIGNKFVSFNDIILKDYQEYLRKKWDLVILTRGVLKEEYQIVTKSGAIRWVTEYGKAVYDENNRTVYLAGYIMDITEIKQSQEAMISKAKELEEEKAKAEDSDKLKSAFLANLSHEIRTPMNTILGFAQMIKDPELTEKQRNYFIDIIFNSGCHLLSIINDIIEISKIETNLVNPNYSAFDLDILLKNIYEEAKVIVPKEKQIELIYVSPKKRAGIIESDAVKLKQILTNLITNAIKFTDKGCVKFGYNLNNCIEFFVEDTGMGIDPEYHKLIFERYKQVDSTKQKRGGSGLGLAISKAYTEMLGGTIHVKSELGKGSVFMFTISYKPADNLFADNKQQIEVSEEEPEYKTMLVAEDDDTNFLYISTLLAKSKNQVIRACNGQEAIELVSKYKNINLVLMDIKMPVMDGFEALKRIRTISPQLPVIAQTAYALPEDERKICKAGFDGYITKPIIKEKLIETINKILK